MSNTEKTAALTAIANGVKPVSAGKSKYRIGQELVHVRFCSEDAAGSTKFKFNINPNTLSADFELWVCGSVKTYYLMPVALMRSIYENPNTYVDRAHPEIRVVSVDTGNNTVTFASGGTYKSLREYLNAKLS
ncbi:MAG: hypothetical protein CVU21_04905 [Betaproteobacteria bacterium HGW-Betaproteobacteria-15]|nr:MAG: hypothetical protein CVU21_04905 [Betaproteobacteria bacterium HGW-Betaproteobacteria-15]